MISLELHFLSANLAPDTEWRLSATSSILTARLAESLRLSVPMALDRRRQRHPQSTAVCHVRERCMATIVTKPPNDSDLDASRSVRA
jgi:hypothetical protein